MKVIKKESEQQIFYTYEDFEREYSNLLTLFNAVEFSHNKIQLTSQQREEKDVFDLINQVLQMQKSLQRDNEANANDIINAIKIFAEISKLITDPKFAEFVKTLKKEG